MLGDTYQLLKHVLDYFPLLLIPGILVFAVLMFFKVHNVRAALLFSLSIPGALFWCVMLPVIVAIFMSPMIVSSLFFILVLFPSAAVLPAVAALQLARLSRATARIGVLGWCTAAAIVVLYFWTALVHRAQT